MGRLVVEDCFGEIEAVTRFSVLFAMLAGTFSDRLAPCATAICRSFPRGLFACANDSIPTAHP